MSPLWQASVVLVTPEARLLRASLALVATCALTLWLIREGSRLAAWLDHFDCCPHTDTEDED